MLYSNFITKCQRAMQGNVDGKGLLPMLTSGVYILAKNHKLFRAHDFEHKEILPRQRFTKLTYTPSKTNFSSDLGHFKMKNKEKKMK